MTTIRPGRQNTFEPQNSGSPPETEVKVSFCGGGDITTSLAASSSFTNPSPYSNTSTPPIFSVSASKTSQLGNLEIQKYYSDLQDNNDPAALSKTSTTPYFIPGEAWLPTLSGTCPPPYTGSYSPSASCNQPNPACGWYPYEATPGNWEWQLQPCPDNGCNCDGVNTDPGYNPGYANEYAAPITGICISF